MIDFAFSHTGPCDAGTAARAGVARAAVLESSAATWPGRRPPRPGGGPTVIVIATLQPAPGAPRAEWAGDAPGDPDYASFRWRLTSFVMSNIDTRVLPPKTTLRASSALIMRRSF
jgi:hypothetical protein